jgi:hypothetical protein
MNEDNSTSKGMGTPTSESAFSLTQTPAGQGNFSGKKPDRSRKKVLLFVGIIIFLGLLGAGIWWWQSQNSATTKNNETASNQPAFSVVCDKSIIQSASKPIGNNDIAALQSITESILQKKNYSGDVNCNYILMRYYLMTGNVAKAQSTLDDVVYTYGRYGGYSTVFDPPAISPAALKDTLDVMIANNKEEQKQNSELDGLDP